MRYIVDLTTCRIAWLWWQL